MINKIVLLTTSLVLALSLSVSPALAATPTPTKITSSTSTTPSISTSSANKALGEKLNEQINELKERIASRVAELNLVEKRGAIGTVKETSGNQITFTDLSGKTRYIDVDEITKFTSISKNGFGMSDLVKGTKISALGLYNKQTQRILARFIDTQTLPTYLSGRIVSTDKKNFTLTVTSEDQKQSSVDVETISVISTYSQGVGISKLGFSKLKIGDRIIVTGFPDKKDPSLLVASRILTLPELPVNPKIVIPEPSITGEITPSPEVTKKPTPTKSIQQ